MSEREPSRSLRSATFRGQSLVEFALVLPLLLVLLLGVADFGRVFQAGIVVEAAARNAAEAAAQEYLQFRRSGPLDAAEYAALRTVATAEVCREAERLPNRAMSGGICSMPFTAVCVHDGSDACGTETPPSRCDEMPVGASSNAAPVPASQFVPDTNDDATAYVTVYVCYRFTTLVNLADLSLPFNAGLSLGEIWLQRERTFVAADY
jgi:hypothetical protein